MENQEIMEQFLENRQNYMMDNNSSMQHMNMNVASVGCDGVLSGGVQAEVVSGSGVAGEILGVKYDEHNEEHGVDDDEEWKYVEEVQQSEKQQHLMLKNSGLDVDEFAEKEIAKAAHVFGNGDGGFVFGGNHPETLHANLCKVSNGHDNHDNVNLNKNGENLEYAGIKKSEGDNSSISNITESAESILPKVDLKIEATPEQQEMFDDEEPSSLATNTTNGTSSLSENVPVQAVAPTKVNAFDDLITNLENKENTDSSVAPRPNDLELDQAHSQLNPDAKEFIPSFGSNTASPTSPFATGMQMQQNEMVVVDEPMYFGQAPSAVARHLLEDDDFVAESPRKGKSDNNMDSVCLPQELSEFEQEADKRPHELEVDNVDVFQQRDEVMTPDQAGQQLPLDDLAVDKGNQNHTDSIDLQEPNIVDHGPETSVDHEVELDSQKSIIMSSLQGEDDVMNRSMYLANDDAIENVLNSVQPIPTEIDSVNNSFIEESATETSANQLAGDKELLQVEEKEHVSHSPSTEEIHMNLQNTLNSSNKDISQLPIDMDNDYNIHPTIMDIVPEVQHHEKEMHQELHEEEPLKKPYLEQEEQLKNGIIVSEQHQEGEELFNEPQFVEENRYVRDTFEEEQDICNYEYLEKQRAEEQLHMEENLPSEKNLKDEQQQQLSEELPLQQEQYHHDMDQEQQRENHDQPQQDFLDINICKSDIHEESILADTTNPLITNDTFLDNSISTNEQIQEVHESNSPFKIADAFSVDPVSNTPNLDAFDSQQEALNDIATPSSTADEKHLLEETKERQLFSMSGLEKEMHEDMIVNDDDHLSQVEEVAATLATTVIENASENLNLSKQEEYYKHLDQQQQEQHPEQEQPNEDIFADDSVIQHDLELPTQLQEHYQEEHHEYEQPEMKEMAQKQDQQFESVSSPEPIHESIESPIEQQHQEDLQSDIVSVEEPIVEAKKSTLLFSTEETEKMTVTTPEEEDNQELASCVVPETAPAELLEPEMNICNETEVERMEDDKDESKLITEITTDQIEEPITEETEKPIADEIKESAIEVVEKPTEEGVKKAVEEEVKTKEEETVIPEENAAPEIKHDISVEAAVATTVAVAATAATAAAGVKLASSPSKKTETVKKQITKTTTSAAKSKAVSTPAAKKPTEPSKKPSGVTAKPRTTPAKPAGTATADKKMSGKTTTTTTTTTRKPLSATSSAISKVGTKTSTTPTATRTTTTVSKTSITSKATTSPRTVSSHTATTRKPTGTLTATSGPLTKSRPASAPAKPTTLGLSIGSTTDGAPKTKPTSPRAALTSQVRKTTPAATGTKSPVKSTITNGVSKTASTLAHKTKTATSTVSNAANKAFTARPAPKFTSSSGTTTTTTTTRRLTVGGTTMASTTTTTTKSGSTPLRKSSPTKTAAGKTPTKSSAGGLKSKATTKPTSPPPAKPAPIRKPIDKTVLATNGETNINKELNGITEMISTNEQQHQSPPNGDFQAVYQLEQQQNGDASIPMQTETLLEPRNEQMPVDLINA